MSTSPRHRTRLLNTRGSLNTTALVSAFRPIKWPEVMGDAVPMAVTQPIKYPEALADNRPCFKVGAIQPVKWPDPLGD